MKKICHISCLLLSFFGMHWNAMPQTKPAGAQCRRHFIIAYDISRPFLKAAKSAPIYHETIISLFKNAAFGNISRRNSTIVETEKARSFSFFDPARDEISFYHFGIARDEFETLRYADNTLPDNKKLESFESKFIKNTNLYWSQYRSANKNISDYFTDAFNTTNQLPDFGPGISLSNYVYPLILDVVPLQYAEEYVLIILSDFLTGSAFGNKKDFERILELYNYKENTSARVIKERVEKNSASFYKTDYFDFSIDSGEKSIGAIAYLIKPSIGSTKAEAYSLFIDGKLDIEQDAYESELFNLTETNIRFTHNNNFYPRSVRLKMWKQSGKDIQVIYDSVVAESAGSSPYTASFNLSYIPKPLSYDSTLQTYTVPPLQLRVPELDPRKDFEQVTLEYFIEGDYRSSESHRMGYWYTASRTIPKDQIDYKSSTPHIVMYYAVPALALLLLVWILVRLGKPKSASIIINGFTDSYESVDYTKYGKLTTPYKFWNAKKAAIPCSLHISYTFSNYLFNWRPSVRLFAEALQMPPGFSVYLKKDHESPHECYPDTPLWIKAPGNSNNVVEFLVEIRQNNETADLSIPQLVKTKLVMHFSQHKFFGTMSISEESSTHYDFHIGPDLGDVWVGFDPGTTGSCITAGNSSENIILGYSGKDEIIDSKIIFDTTESYTPQAGTEKIPKNCYKYGQKAVPEFGNANVVSFQSIKKLLGFTDQRIISFKGGRSLPVTGKKLTSLLIDGIYHDLKSLVEKNPAKYKDLLKSGHFNPQRAVIAIPNNFTATKIKDILSCLDYLEQFREVRYISEAEAVLFYYLYNYRQFNGKDADLSNETILVFDMGGATINTTIVHAYKSETRKYKIDVLGKLGYGIGGDTIDYCIIKSILQHSEKYKALNFETPFNKTGDEYQKDRKKYTDIAIQLQKAAFEVKKKIIESHALNAEALIKTYELENILRDLIKGLNNTESFIIDENSDLYKMFTSKGGENTRYLLKNNYFTGYIYNNVRDVIRDTLALCENVKIDKVIFSGRSCEFPLIKETVKEVLKTYGSEPQYPSLDPQKSKTAVAVGACWYGVNRNAIELNNVQTNASFGIQHRTGPQKEHLQYIELIAAAKKFNNSELNGIKYLEDYSDIKDRFAHDNLNVNFFQVMGKDAVKILSENQKHKFSKIVSIPVNMETKFIQMRVFENDKVECGVRLVTNEDLTGKGEVSDQEIADANEEHYTWLIQ